MSDPAAYMRGDGKLFYQPRIGDDLLWIEHRYSYDLGKHRAKAWLTEKEAKDYFTTERTPKLYRSANRARRVATRAVKRYGKKLLKGEIKKLEKVAHG